MKSEFCHTTLVRGLSPLLETKSRRSAPGLQNKKMTSLRRWAICTKIKNAFFSTCCSTCVARAACFVFCSIFLTTFLFPCSFSYKFDRHLCLSSAYWSTHNLVHMPILIFHLPISNYCVCISKRVYAIPSSSTSMHTYRHIHMYGLCSVKGFCKIEQFVTQPILTPPMYPRAQHPPCPLSHRDATTHTESQVLGRECK